jgi:hypothetical protein
MMLILAMLAAAAAAPQPGELKTFRDWTVGCDNVRACHATSLMPENGDWDRPVAIGIQRGPDAASRPRITIFGTEGSAGAIVADGKRLAARITQGESDDEVDPGSSAEVVAALRQARSIVVVDKQGKEIGRISPAGVSAALLYMDDMQKRIGTVTALVKTGPQRASAVPAPPAMPVIRSAAAPVAKPVQVSAAEIAALRKKHECIPENPEWPGYDVQQEALDANHSLILLGCGAGAYNSSEVPLIASRSGGSVRVEVARFDVTFNQDGPLPMLVNSGWAPEAQVLTSFSKGRGVGDCGIGSDYAWDGERFRLIQRIEMQECRGSIDYITTWRAQLVKR